MIAFGFSHADGLYRYETDFLGGGFTAIVTVTEYGAVNGKVVDRMNGEEYLQLRMEQFDGAYVNSVRSAYEDVLRRIADACCIDVLFLTDQANRISDRMQKKYGIMPDFPWGQSPHEHSAVFRHADSQKWFALVMNLPIGILFKNADRTLVDVVNLKNDPNDADELHKQTGVFPAYHMNHKNWITVLLDDTLTDDAVMELIDRSFTLTEKHKRRSGKEIL